MHDDSILGKKKAFVRTHVLYSHHDLDEEAEALQILVETLKMADQMYTELTCKAELSRKHFTGEFDRRLEI